MSVNFIYYNTQVPSNLRSQNLNSSQTCLSEISVSQFRASGKKPWNIYCNGKSTSLIIVLVYTSKQNFWKQFSWLNW